jgi:hypothetical protein
VTDCSLKISAECAGDAEKESYGVPVCNACDQKRFAISRWRQPWKFVYWNDFISGDKPENPYS